MRSAQTKLYSFAAPLALLPLMNVSLSEFSDYFRGTEFLTTFSEVLIQLISSVVDAFILVITQGLFGVFGS